jgi:DNA invertase Pin-like site-specific DNA recombinase
MKAYTYLRTSGDDGKKKAGIPVQRQGCEALAKQKGYEIEKEFVDDGVSGKTPMHARPAGKQLIAALLADGVTTVIVYDAKRVGRSMPAYWSFAGVCRDNHISLIDHDGTDLLSTIQGGFHALMAEEDRNRTVERLAAGKVIAKAAGRRTDGRIAYGEHPERQYDHEREVVKQICELKSGGASCYAIALILSDKQIRTRAGKAFKIQTIQNILQRREANG